MFDDEMEEIVILRKNNRVQRSVNQALRRTKQKLQDKSDELFLTLCESGTEAELAMEKLRTFGGIECDPKDYDTIVDKCLIALEALSAIDQSE